MHFHQEHKYFPWHCFLCRTFILQIFLLNHKLGESYERHERPGKKYYFLLSSTAPLYPHAVYLVGFKAQYILVLRFK